MPIDARLVLLKQHLEPMLNRTLQHRGAAAEGMGFSADLIGWIEVSGGPTPMGDVQCS